MSFSEFKIGLTWLIITNNAADEEELGCKRLVERKGRWDLSSTYSRDHLGCSGEMAFGINRRLAPLCLS